MPPVARLKVGEKKRTTIAAGATETVDSQALTKFRGLRYFITSWNGTQTKVMDMTVRKVSASAVDDSVFGRLGDLPITIGAKVSGSDMILEVTNPNAFAINVEVFKFIMGQ